ncbi:MAG: arsenic metallochaperone ArsD family protein [Thermochromatium sp.]
MIKELEAGMDCLPLTLIDGRIVARGAYLSRDQLIEKLELTLCTPPATANPFRVQANSGCCKPGSGCC